MRLNKKADWAEKRLEFQKISLEIIQLFNESVCIGLTTCFLLLQQLYQFRSPVLTQSLPSLVHRLSGCGRMTSRRTLNLFI